MKTLFVILGQSPMIIAQALLLKPEIERCCIITTDQRATALPKGLDPSGLFKMWEGLFELWKHFPDVQFDISLVKGIYFPDTGEQSAAFMNVLLYWYLAKLKGLQGKPLACISGGPKHLPAMMQKAAEVLGAEDIFHILAHPMSYKQGRPIFPSTLPEVSEAAEKGKLDWVSLGQSEKISQLSEQFSAEKNLIREREGELELLSLKPSAPDFYAHLQSLVGQSTTIQPARLPFPSLTLLHPSIRSWLEQPLTASDREWVLRLPKTELHCHLGGFADSGESLQQVRAAAERPELLPPVRDIAKPEGWPLPSNPIALDHYMRLGDNTGSKLLTDRGCLIMQVRALYAHLKAQHVGYAEIRCSPYNYVRNSSSFRSAIEVLDCIKDTFDKCRRDDNQPITVNLLIIATRKNKGDLSDISKHLALAICSFETEDDGCKVVGVDLAGYESEATRPDYFQSDFISVHRVGLAITVHAGENDDAESIWQAVYKLHARRLGHGLYLLEAKDLLRTVVERQIGVEMCPYANYQIKGFRPMNGVDDQYPLLAYLRRGVKVSVNTDNIGISSASITDNFMLLPDMCEGITRMEVLQLIRNGIESAFLSAEQKWAHLEKFDRDIFNTTATYFQELP